MNILSGVFISSQGLGGLKDYKYHGVDRSLIANYVFQPFWRKAVNILPLWVAPNLVTLIGFFFIIISYLAVAYYVPHLEGEAPRWVYLFCAINLFLYQTFDALDGKQARRTNTSSPLGELFDHGCDAVTTVLQALTAATVIQLGSGSLLVSFVVCCMLTFYIKQWEEYHTDVMDLGVVNVTEAQLLTIITYLLTFFYGPSFWLSGFYIFGFFIKYQYLCLSFCFIGGIVTCIDSIVRLLFGIGAPNVKPNISEALIHLLPAIITIGTTFLWIRHNPILLTKYPHPTMLSFGFIFANLVGKIVLARVCKEHFSIFQPLLIPLVIGYINSFFNGRFITDGYFIEVLCV